MKKIYLSESNNSSTLTRGKSNAVNQITKQSFKEQNPEEAK